MKITAKELEALVCNTEGMNDYLKSCIGSSLCNALYDSANTPEDYPDEYSVLYDASFYNTLSNDDIFLCLSYIEDVLQEDLEKFELIITL